jgi:hypothetical protein
VLQVTSTQWLCQAPNASTMVEADKDTEWISEIIYYMLHEAEQEAFYLVDT